ncbi:MAG: hypothetical protein ACOCRO_02400 [Halanaerobiales bacterium]
MKKFSLKFAFLLLILSILTFLSLSGAAAEDVEVENQGVRAEKNSLLEENRSPSDYSLLLDNSDLVEGPGFSFPGSVEFPGRLNPFDEDETDLEEGAYIYQIGDGNLATITQTGEGNFAEILQNGNNNDAYITQDGNANWAKIEQKGNGFVANIEQYGNEHEASIIQPEESQDKHEIIQKGNNNSASTAIFGNTDSVRIEQVGNNMDLNVDAFLGS